MIHRMFTTWEAHSWGELLGAEFMQFTAPNSINGLARIVEREHKGRVLQLLAVASDKPGQGNFSRFMQCAMRNFDTIEVLHIESAVVNDYCKRHSFTPFKRIEEDGETIAGFTRTSAEYILEHKERRAYAGTHDTSQSIQ